MLLSQAFARVRRSIMWAWAPVKWVVATFREHTSLIEDVPGSCYRRHSFFALRVRSWSDHVGTPAPRSSGVANLENLCEYGTGKYSIEASKLQHGVTRNRRNCSKLLELTADDGLYGSGEPWLTYRGLRLPRRSLSARAQ